MNAALGKHWHETAKCHRCGHKGVGQLNIEGSIHHNTDIACIDHKACRRRQRKNK